jgi:hypothetical protein
MNHKQTEKFSPGIGATKDLSLRVSVAALVRVLFEHPGESGLMLALERKATLHQTGSGRVIKVKSQPFGGAIRILDLRRLRDLTGDFHFDSERSHAEQDFRIFIRPGDWSIVREVCIRHFNQAVDPMLETDPGRELAEEFAEALKVDLKPHQYIHKPVATVVEDDPSPAENTRASVIPTVRVYRIFEASITDSSLAQAMIKNSESLSDHDLSKIAWEDAQNGGDGGSNAVLALPLKLISDVYSAMSPKRRNTPVLFGRHWLDETVTTILDGLIAPKYQRL